MPVGVVAGRALVARVAARCRREIVIDIPVEEREIRVLHARVASNARWSRADQEERRAQSRKAHRGLEAKFIQEIDPDGKLPPEELAARLKNRKRQHYSEMALRKAKLERDRRQREEKAAQQAVKKKAAAPPAATGEATREPGVSALKSEQESQ